MGIMMGDFMQHTDFVNIYNSQINERAYIQNFNSVLNKFNSKFIEKNVEALYDILDEFKPYIYGQFNLEIISILKRMNCLIIAHEQYLPKYYFFCGQAYHYLMEREESKKYFRLAISYGMKYKQHRIVGYSIWNYELVSFKDKDIIHADQISRLVASLYTMDESLHDEYNRSLLAHLSAAAIFNQFNYVEVLLRKIEHLIPMYCKDWVDLMVLKASIYRRQNQYIQAFEILSELYPRLNKRIVKASTIPRILNEIHLLSEHLDKMNESTHVKTQLLKGYLEFICENKAATSEIERIECNRLPFVSEKSVFVEKAEELLAEHNDSLFICIDIKSNMISNTILHNVQLKLVNEIYASFNQTPIISYALSVSTIVCIIENTKQTEQIEKQVERILNLVKDQQLSVIVSEIFHFTVLSNRKYEVYNYNDAQNLANAIFYYELCKRV